MIWWWRARALTAVSLALAGSLAAGIMIGSQVLPLPSLVGALFVPVVFAYLLPLVPVVALWYGMDRSVGALDKSAARPIVVWDLAMRGGMVLIAAMVTGATTVGGWWQLGPGYLRNLIGCLGLAQLVAPFVGPRLAGLAPVCAVIISALFGTGPGGLARWWAWPIAEARSGLAFAAAGLLLTAGITAAVWPAASSRGRSSNQTTGSAGPRSPVRQHRRPKFQRSLEKRGQRKRSSARIGRLP